MRIPSDFLRTQTVTLLTPTAATGAPTNGGYAKTYTKKVIPNARYGFQRTVSPEKRESNDLYVVIYDTTGFKSAWDIVEGETLIVLGDHNSTTPPENSKYYKVNAVSVRYNPDGSVHNVRVTAR